ncbi:UDP-N-acetylmuramoyl-L-alanyl-D-glutamate--2,6-diaminopimelate ligase [Shouchella clausii]|uniref:UDP-N-acetylmuramoyl-L-alanyl-D-glutamate--2, 6-diaminopimelate ligase n=1 Tax=Shouchella clausii TaxID=79880 RepID=UPI0021487BAB|nr:UDP-N-acetylmuramoyl-L-alanyl-D-glutamate--2,6-diaminopimelate ligase [Shouchella clausii]MCR1290231.1 UDP-N-acetylmuramoyl-L-alanyl-D-glutamate--2,6-diaminopimelate ligase [Shouchella clausii]
MLLRHLLDILEYEELYGSDAVDITGITNNSKTVKPGDLFIAIAGYSIDGHKFIDQAIAAGAKAVIGEKEIGKQSVPYIKVTDSRKALALAAKRFYKNEQNKAIMIGITGTNGKTTTSYMLKHILETCGHTCSLFGSVQNIVNGQVLPATTNTTMDALELQRQLAASNDQVVIMEVTSHALMQHRVYGIEFDYGLFTNLSQDHLDYHGSMEAYFGAKLRLFEQLAPAGKAVIHAQGEWGEAFLASLKKMDVPYIYTLGGAEATLQLSNVRIERPMQATLAEDHKAYDLKVPLLGEHNVYNAAIAFLTVRLLGLNARKMLAALEKFPGVPGRFELIHHPKGANIVIDYAHTEEAFYHCLKTAKELNARRIIHVFGFRGNRDTSKRQAMVNVSKRFSHFIILTMDDLNGESFERMRKKLENYQLGENGVVIPDRTSAIAHAWELAENGDWVFITGKGHEAYRQSYHLPTQSDKDTVQHLWQRTIASKMLVD